MNIFKKIKNYLFKPKEKGLCFYCGGETTETNEFIYTRDKFRHKICSDIAYENTLKEKRDRRTIELYKQAIREVNKENKE